MQRVKTSTAAAEKPAYSATGMPGFFTSGNAVAAIPATVMGQDWPNMIQEELANVITSAGLELSAEQDTQLRDAIQVLIENAVPDIGAATTAAAGIVELATNAEAVAGEDATRAITPAGLAAGLAALLTALLAAANAWTKAQRYTPSTLTITSGAVTWDVQAHPVAVLTLNANVTSFTISNAEPGATYELTVIQDGTGSRTLSWPAALLWTGGTALAVTSTANAADLFMLSARDNGGTTVLRITGAQNMKAAS